MSDASQILQPMTSQATPRPGDATLTVTKAARLLGVHPNTVRAWSEQGRLRYYRINERGDRRYRLADLQRFLTAAASGTTGAAPHGPASRGTAGGAATRPPAPDTGARMPVRRGPRATVPPWLTSAQAPGEDDVPEAVGPGAIDLLADLAELAASAVDLDQALADICRRTRAATGAVLVGVWERFPAGLVVRAADGPGGPAGNALSALATHELPRGFGVLRRALVERGPVRARATGDGDLTVLDLGVEEIAVAIQGPDGPWGVLLLAGASTPGPDGGLRLARALGRTLGTLLRSAHTAESAAGRLSRSEALRRVATDLASRLDLGDVLHDLVDHVRVMFGADRVAVVLRDIAGPAGQPAGSGFSQAYLSLARDLETGRDVSGTLPGRRPAVLLGEGALVTDSPIRGAAVGESLHTLLVAPLADADGIVGMLHVGHGRAQAWTPSDIDAVAALAGDAAMAIRTARAFGRMATWAAQLQAIQSLGVRLSGLTQVDEIGEAIATELQQLIDFHNVRVYRLADEELYPVAMRGRIGEYTDERPDQLRISIGQGITGWVARHRVPQLLADASSDPRAMTIPGTEENLPESMLLAPMVYEDQCLGVLVLSKLGLDQFTDDDLRLLVIYASFAAQAMANADATERLRSQSAALERRLRAQRELLRITESMLATLDPQAVLNGITDQLSLLIECDNIAIGAVDGSTGTLVHVSARGAHAEGSAGHTGQATILGHPMGTNGIGAWVVAHNEPVLIDDKRKDPRVIRTRGPDDSEGSLIVVPLSGRHGAIRMLSLERVGSGARFDQDDFELVQLFAGQASIALRNAEAVHAVEIRARTDALTGLLNQGTFRERLTRRVAAAEPFSLVMIDLDIFKEVNDRLGHQAGDRLLGEIAKAITGAARDTDAVFRYGGDEFTVILPRADAAQALAVAERIGAAVAAVGEPGTIWHGEGRTVSASIGVASFPVDGDDEVSLLLAADRACFVAKRRGRNNIATAEEGLALAAEFTLSEPTPVDPPSPLAIH